jgi:hypothetical protein
MATPITEEQRKQYVEDGEKAMLLKESLKIVDELAKFDIDDFSNYDNAEFDFEPLEKLIKKAKILSKNRLWKLK